MTAVTFNRTPIITGNAIEDAPDDVIRTQQQVYVPEVFGW